MTLKLNGSTDGSVSIDAPADTSPSGTDVTLTLPTSAGSSGQYLQTDGSGGLSWQTVATGVDGFTWLTGQDLNGEAAVTFTGIPTTANIIKIGFAEVSQNGTFSGGQINVRVGNGSINSSTNYRYAGSYGGTAHDSDSASEWRLIAPAFTAGNTLFNGTMELIRIASANWWCCSWNLGDHGGNNETNVGGGFYNGSSGLIDRIQIFNGNSTFDDGNVVVGYA